MRIIAGKYKGRRIAFPEHIRPTQDKVRQAIFDTLGQVFNGRVILDLFAGSGAFGIEALSRGAEKVVFVDIERKCNLLIKNNLEGPGLALGHCRKVEIYRQDAFRAIVIAVKKKRKFDVIFADPPYHKGLAKKLLKTSCLGDILTTHGFLVVEHAATDEIDLGSGVAAFELYKQANYGKIAVTFLMKR
ncbi:MAG: 16S rRNA (guanine(966)-N(2))-methyltransferase RsmD [Candidatus Omnitrophica bacterium CG1_02_44_16]|nr:MAG: 16S rRNA (guanine(966)-N(2))-methyltransferase RsmD [Candidatus Omnitrophica bacterium CG1_02_44_16]PIY82092.1 MAG: 16S rRNA (guanine(966)-N(2))-methyltransferase RsmD [Candidatus Omnitrophica bacterium CG_4_10_14_0_8_um_filter_44_12]PIZ83280.1 MAG: 16S rRNA (guanine(966)-N(2))-methyltransferase RsmD [Candidatus Omnitrophica bacterium CG_4_10_14_0_2_um_filter_44_9]